MALGDRVLSKLGQSRNDKCCMILLTRGPERSQMHRGKEESGGCLRVGGGEMGSCCLMEIEFPFGKMKKS